MSHLRVFSAIACLALAACTVSSSPPPSGTRGGDGTTANADGDAGAGSTGQPGVGAPGGGADSCMPAGTKTGDACTDEGQSCSAVEWCATGLVTDDEKMTCTSGAWQHEGPTCPADGALTSDGCPGAQPANGDACTVEGARCHYARVCVVGACPDAGTTDGSACAPANRAFHEYATCTSGRWTTTALPACP